MTICTRLVVTYTTRDGKPFGYYEAWVPSAEPVPRRYEGQNRAEAVGKCVLSEPCFTRPCGPLTVTEADHVHAPVAPAAAGKGGVS